ECQMTNIKLQMNFKCLMTNSKKQEEMALPFKNQNLRRARKKRQEDTETWRHGKDGLSVLFNGQHKTRNQE
ncbi:hypothetical protein KAT67_09420, partial [candidate division WOR-3 bacterium]|nr:hypothetical protein [candidate division WOR-3 bacterium]